MSTLAETDLLLGEALDDLVGAATVCNSLEDGKIAQDLRRKIAHCVNVMWEIREWIYSCDSSAKPEFVDRYETESGKVDGYFAIHSEAHAAESEGDLARARDLYSQLLVATSIDLFKRYAEAGLYRTTMVSV